MSAAIDIPAGVRGSRTLMSEGGKALAMAFPDEIRAELMADRFKLRWLSALEAGIGQCDRTCMRVYAEAVKLVGGQVDLAVLIVNQIGAPAPEARRAVDFTREVEAYAEDEPALMAKLAGELSAYMARTGVSFESLCAKASGAEVVG